MKAFILAAVAAVVLAPVSGHAKVASSTSTGFAVTYETVVTATPEAVWQAMMQPAKWWSGEHSWSGSATNFTMSARPGGCFCEILPEGGFAEQLMCRLPGSTRFIKKRSIIT